jgi:Lrp/AsnC family transcriptional regulator
MKPDLDAADIRILSVLQENSDLSIAQISERIHLSTNACWRRLKRLEERGYLLGRVALLSPERLGLGIIAHISLRLTEQSAANTSRFVDAVMQIRNVTEISAMSGEIGFFLKTYTRDLAEHEKLVGRLVSENSFSYIRSEFVLRSYHNTTILPLF